MGGRSARLLYERGAQQVWAWGSLGEGFTIDASSDIDLAVEGLSEWLVESVLTELRDRSPYKIDIVRIEETSVQVRWFIRRGRALARDAPLADAPNRVRRNLRHHRLHAVHEVLRQAGARRDGRAYPLRNDLASVGRDRPPCDRIFASPSPAPGPKVTQAAGRTSLP